MAELRYKLPRVSRPMLTRDKNYQNQCMLVETTACQSWRLFGHDVEFGMRSHNHVDRHSDAVYSAISSTR